MWFRVFLNGAMKHLTVTGNFQQIQMKVKYFRKKYGLSPLYCIPCPLHTTRNK